MWISTERRKLSEFAEREALIHKADNTGVRDEKTAKMSESGHQPRSNNNAYALHTRHEDDCAQSGVRCQETRTETAASMSHKNSDSTLGSSPPAVPKAVGLTSKPPATALITDSCQRIVATDNEMTPKLIADNPCPRLRDACCSRGRTCAGERAERANIASAVVDPAPSSDPEITRPEW